MVTEVDAGEIRFRRSRRRVLGRVACAALVVLPAFALLGVAFGNAWYNPLPHGPILLLAAIRFPIHLRRQGGLPLRLTRDFLELTVPGGGTVQVDWPDLTRAEVRGGFSPTLVVDIADRARSRPVLDRWEWGRVGLWSRARGRSPQEIHVSLVATTPNVHRLRAELAHRMSRVADDPSPRRPPHDHPLGDRGEGGGPSSAGGGG
ncbi:hypothetical protein NIE79_003541 [Micromonospora sp. NIE79]|uniref:PH domain-containing protein n=1 Tax=Micromonospora trifolii TaxID=2911208 RepID=A0ABS9N572_9ACTN|nr:hypothetical protein [Micromonospora trifolii]MCG5445098.1 hypothetical protein [Micromonospora trifolii]